jgi:hypothetical protein
MRTDQVLIDKADLYAFLDLQIIKPPLLTLCTLSWRNHSPIHTTLVHA